MTTIQVNTASSQYPIQIEAGLLQRGEALLAHICGQQVLVVSNTTVAPLYLDQVRQSLDAAENQLEVQTLLLPDGEQWKTSDTWSQILDQLVAMQAARDATVIALGGGVVGDLAGFAAASYMRGIGIVQIPTTLLAQVDSSVGGKTGINHAGGKNLIGAFHQPLAVLIDPLSLETLPQREYVAGLAEVVKYGILGDEGFFAWLEENREAVMQRQAEALHFLIARSVNNKARIVAEDEKEQGVRALLNFGHTFGHAIETLTGYRKYLHGEAVAIGMVLAASLSEQTGLCDSGITARIKTLLKAFNLPVKLPSDLLATELLETMRIDKKVRSGKMRYILLHQLGEAFVNEDVADREVAAILSATD